MSLKKTNQWITILDVCLTTVVFTVPFVYNARYLSRCTVQLLFQLFVSGQELSLVPCTRERECYYQRDRHDATAHEQTRHTRKQRSRPLGFAAVPLGGWPHHLAQHWHAASYEEGECRADRRERVASQFDKERQDCECRVHRKRKDGGHGSKHGADAAPRHRGPIGNHRQQRAHECPLGSSMLSCIVKKLLFAAWSSRRDRTACTKYGHLADSNKPLATSVRAGSQIVTDVWIR